MVDRDTGEELEGTGDDEEVIVNGKDARIRVEARNDGVDQGGDEAGKQRQCRGRSLERRGAHLEEST